MQKRHVLLFLRRPETLKRSWQAPWCALVWCFMLTFAVATDWQWHAVNPVGTWGHSASYSVLSSSGASVPFPAVTNADGISYGGFIFPYDRRVMRVRDDFDGDGKSDCFYYHQPSQVWYFILSSATQEVIRASFGLPNAVPALEDYDGDKKIDLAVYQESSGTWLVALSAHGYASVSVGGFGGPGYSAVPADFDGDLRADPAIYQPASGNWTLMLSASGYVRVGGNFGGPGFTPFAGDFDMDDKIDPMIYNETQGALSIAMSGSGYLSVTAGYGGPGFSMFSDDYDGDGCADVAAYGRENGLCM